MNMNSITIVLPEFIVWAILVGLILQAIHTLLGMYLSHLKHQYLKENGKEYKNEPNK